MIKNLTSKSFGMLNLAIITSALFIQSCQENQPVKAVGDTEKMVVTTADSVAPKADTIPSAIPNEETPVAVDTVKQKDEAPTYDFTKVKVGGRFMGGVVIKKKPTEIVIASPKPIGSGGWNDAKKLASRYKLGGFKWRLPSPAELELIFSMRNLLDGYEQNWYWTNNTQGNMAEHIGISRGDHAFVPMEHGKFVFVVSTVKAN